MTIRSFHNCEPMFPWESFRPKILSLDEECNLSQGIRRNMRRNISRGICLDKGHDIVRDRSRIYVVICQTI